MQIEIALPKDEVEKLIASAGLYLATEDGKTVAKEIPAWLLKTAEPEVIPRFWKQT